MKLINIDNYWPAVALALTLTVAGEAAISQPLEDHELGYITCNVENTVDYMIATNPEEIALPLALMGRDGLIQMILNNINLDEAAESIALAEQGREALEQSMLEDQTEEMTIAEQVLFNNLLDCRDQYFD